MAEDVIYKTNEEITELLFLSFYDREYRYFKQILLENEYDNLNKIVPSLDDDQCAHLRLMIEIEMIVNAIQYCNELGATAICVKKNRLHELGHMLANMNDHDIEEFYKNISGANLEEIKRYMGYDKLAEKDYEDDRYLESCKRYRGMIYEISNLYTKYSYFYLSYKHGLRIIPSTDINGNTVIAAPLGRRTGKPHECRLLVCNPTAIQGDTITIVNIVHHIYTKLYIPLFRRKLLELVDVSPDEYAKLGASKTLESSEPARPGYNFKTTASMRHPYWANDGSKPKPFL